METDIIFLSPRPSLTVEGTGSRSLGRCYSEATYRVTSRQPLDRKTLKALSEAGVLGYGQEFGVMYATAAGGSEPVPETVEWNTRPEPTGWDDVPAVQVVRGTTTPTGAPAINTYTGLPYGPQRMPFYVYNVVRRVDSSD